LLDDDDRVQLSDQLLEVWLGVALVTDGGRQFFGGTQCLRIMVHFLGQGGT
jgi:hypothetical protein